MKTKYLDKFHEPHKNILQTKNMSPYTIHFVTPKEKFHLEYLSSYSKKCDFRKFPPIRGEISTRGSMSPNMQILYMYPTTHHIFNPVPSGLWILENVAILKLP